MALLILFNQLEPDYYLREFKALDAELDICVWPDAGDVEQIDYAVVWKPEAGVLRSLPNLKVIFFDRRRRRPRLR